MTENSFQIVNTWKYLSDRNSITIKASFHSVFNNYFFASFNIYAIFYANFKLNIES